MDPRHGKGRQFRRSIGSIHFLAGCNSQEGNAYYNFGTDAHYEQLYFQKYIKFNPISAAALALNVGDVSSNSVMMPWPSSLRPASTENG